MVCYNLGEDRKGSAYGQKNSKTIGDGRVYLYYCFGNPLNIFPDYRLFRTQEQVDQVLDCNFATPVN